jgi:protein-serine/threonine kinase
MKSLIKTEMFKKDQLAHVRSERDILAESDSPWVVKLYTTFQDAYFLYMLMEFLPGGDLMTMLIKYEIFSEDITRFYIAEIVLAIEAVHKLGFIHRSAAFFLLLLVMYCSIHTNLLLVISNLTIFCLIEAVTSS